MKNKESLVIDIATLADLDKIKPNTKYINFDLNNIDFDVIKYFLEYGEDFMYSDSIDSKKGYIYVDFNKFKEAENTINMIYANMPNDLNELEKARYIYIAVGKNLYFNINYDQDKNEYCSLENINIINNIWGSLSTGCATKISVLKIYYYICKRIGIQISFVGDDNIEEQANILNIDKYVLNVDLFKDIPFIQAKMSTKHFTPFNSDESMDKKIKYIKNHYTDYYLDKSLKNIDYTADNALENLLFKTQKVIDIENIRANELSIIYQHIFNKYCYNYNIKINNLFLNNETRNHFIMISYNDIHYSYNFRKKTFVKVSDIDILNNLSLGKIGLYLDEFIPNIKLKV